MVRAIFLDRDGVINELIPDHDKQRSPRVLEEFLFTYGIRDFVVQLRSLGFVIAVITNQPEVKRGLVSRPMVDSFHKKIQTELGVEDFFVCWHDNDDLCDCRKPKPGLLLQAAAVLNIDLSTSFMVGDRLKDVEAARAAGCIGVIYGKSVLENTFCSTSFSEIFNFIKNQN